MYNIIDFNNVSHSYGKNIGISNLTFGILRNESTAIVGNNGSGKSTIINILCNLFSYTTGTVSVCGNILKPSNNTYKNKIGFLLSRPYFIREFSILDYWNFVAKFHNLDLKTAENRISELLRGLDLLNEAAKTISSLSTGHQLRTALGAMLLHNPEILIMDEPFTNLDFNTTELLHNILLKLKGKKTILVTSHQIELIADICDRFILLDNGIIQDEFRRDSKNNKEITSRIYSSLLKNIDLKLDWLFT